MKTTLFYSKWWRMSEACTIIQTIKGILSTNFQVTTGRLKEYTGVGEVHEICCGKRKRYLWMEKL